MSLQSCKRYNIHQGRSALICSGVDVSYNLRGQGHSGQAIKLEADRNSFLFSAPKLGCLVIFGFSRLRPKMNFNFCVIFPFRSKVAFALGQKCYVRNWTVTKFCDRGTGDFRLRLMPEMKDAFSICFYSKLFQITPYVNGFQILNNPGSRKPVDASKNSFTLHF